MKSFILLLLLLSLVLVNINNSKFVVYAQLSGDNSICSSDTNSPCEKLNNLLSPCGSKFGPPPSNIQAYEYTVDDKNLASCMCDQDAYDTLSSCVSCYSNGNTNIRAINFVDYQKSCKNYGFTFGPPINDDSPPTSSIAIKVSIAVAGFVFILGCILIWLWYKKKSKPSTRDDGLDREIALSEQEMSAHQPHSSSNNVTSSRNNNSNQRNSSSSSQNQRSSTNSSSSQNPILSTNNSSPIQRFSNNNSQLPMKRISSKNLQLTTRLPSNYSQSSSERLPSSYSQSSSERFSTQSSTEGLLLNSEPTLPPRPTLYPPLGVIQVPSQSQHFVPRYNVPSQQTHFIPQQPTYSLIQPSSAVQLYTHPPLIRNNQQPQLPLLNNGNSLPGSEPTFSRIPLPPPPPPPHNYYNPNNYYGGH